MQKLTGMLITSCFWQIGGCACSFIAQDFGTRGEIRHKSSFYILIHYIFSMGFCTSIGDDYQPCWTRGSCNHPSDAKNVLQCTHPIPCCPGRGIIDRRCAVTSYTTREYLNEQIKETSLLAHGHFSYALIWFRKKLGTEHIVLVARRLSWAINKWLSKVFNQLIWTNLIVFTRFYLFEGFNGFRE